MQAVIYLAAVALVCGLFAAVSVAVARILQRHRRTSPWAVFKGLSTAHGLDRAAVRLLRDICQTRRLSHPALVFLEPRWLDEAASDPRHTGLAAAIRAKIFAPA